MIHRSMRRTFEMGIGLLLVWTGLSAPVRGGGLTVIANFYAPTSGANPDAGLTSDANGNLYGTTDSDGPYYGGTVWEIAKGTNTITTLAAFQGSTGTASQGGVTFDANGNLYGTALTGGADNDGTVWEIKAGSGTITPLASFNGTDGANPIGNVAFDANGNLYGATRTGGAYDYGTVWEIKAGTSTITTLGSFNGGYNSGPLAGVTFAANGNLYGTTNAGGAYGYGMVWEIKAGSSTVTTLASFNGTNGAEPQASVTVDAKGDLFGTTFIGSGNSSAGTVWEIKAGSSTITTLATFGTNGSFPTSNVILDAKGDLFGTTGFGGTDGRGTVWEIAAGTSTLTTLASFNGSNGSTPTGDLTLDDHGNLFGTTLGGGTDDSGTVWEIQGTSVPEPSSLVLGWISLATAGGAVIVRNRRRS